MRRGTIVCLLAAGIVAGTALAAAAQPAGGAPPPPDEAGGPGSVRRPGAQDKDLAGRIGTMRVWALTKDMDLTPEESAKLFPIIHKYDKQRADVLKEARGDLIGLYDALKSASPDEKGLKDLIERIDTHQERLARIQKEERKEIGAILPTKRLAQFILSTKRFEHKLQAVVGQMAERRGAGAGQGAGPGRWQPGGRLDRRMQGGAAGPPPPPPGGEGEPDAGF